MAYPIFQQPFQTYSPFASLALRFVSSRLIYRPVPHDNAWNSEETFVLIFAQSFRVIDILIQNHYEISKIAGQLAASPVSEFLH